MRLLIEVDSTRISRPHHVVRSTVKGISPITWRLGCLDANPYLKNLTAWSCPWNDSRGPTHFVSAIKGDRLYSLLSLQVWLQPERVADLFFLTETKSFGILTLANITLQQDGVETLFRFMQADTQLKHQKAICLRWAKNVSLTPSWIPGNSSLTDGFSVLRRGSAGQTYV